jgi:hypothetical protein
VYSAKSFENRPFSLWQGTPNLSGLEIAHRNDTKSEYFNSKIYAIEKKPGYFHLYFFNSLVLGSFVVSF